MTETEKALTDALRLISQLTDQLNTERGEHAITRRRLGELVQAVEDRHNERNEELIEERKARKEVADLLGAVLEVTGRGRTPTQQLTDLAEAAVKRARAERSGG